MALRVPEIGLQFGQVTRKVADTPYKVAVTQMFVKYAELVDRLVGRP